MALDPAQISSDFIGRHFDHDLLADLPDEIDPCGENGEFHTFVYDGPIFREPVSFTTGEVVVRDTAVFIDLIPPTNGSVTRDD